MYEHSDIIYDKTYLQLNTNRARKYYMFMGGLTQIAKFIFLKRMELSWR